MDAPHGSDRPKIGLVLSGGGSRGAYEVGVLRYISERLPKPANFDVISGTSCGAINGAYVAATRERPRAACRLLARVWSEMDLDNVYGFGWAQMRHVPQLLFGRSMPSDTVHGSTVGGLVDPKFLTDLVRRRIPWSGISDNLAKGRLEGFALLATELATGVTTIFVQTASGRIPDHWTAQYGQAIVPTAITSAHCLASGAIPMLFPAVRVGDQLFVDGSLRQNTPILPALRLGANRLLVISLKHESELPEHTRRQRRKAREIYPSAMFVTGKMFNALMLDKLDAELARVQDTNALLAAGTQNWGDDFGAKMATAMRGPQAKPYVPVDVLRIQPSQDLAQIAYECIHKDGLRQYRGIMAKWLRRTVLESGEAAESDLASYILFDSEYMRRLIDLGYHDAEAQHDKLVELFDV